MTTLDENPTRSPRGKRIPFPTVDEVSRHCLQDQEPETVHIEVHLTGRLEASRFSTAFTEALRRHPRILMREAPRRWYGRRYEWELTEGPEVHPVGFPAPGPDALKRARARCLDQAPPLTASPPVRVEVIEEPRTGTSILVVTINHTALDGPACLRVLATAAELYGGRDNSAPPAAPPAPAPAAAQPPPSSWARPARVAPGTPEPRPGNGLLVCELPVPRRPKGAPYTVNDQLMVATARTIAYWNEEHGVHRPHRPLRITMPVDDRPRDETMPIGNGTRLVEVALTPAELTLPMPELLRRTATRTAALKSLVRPQLGHGAALLTTPYAPVAWRAAATRALRTAAGPWTSTTLLSNIGRIPYPLDFGDGGRASAVWFSAPARMPRGLTVTTASTAGRLHLALRWSRTLLSHGDGAHLRDLFEHHLHATQEEAP
ncbi:condensation protein [Streptomyces sp. VRA16 Mangrove soil]|uniref:condensation protein n=1 Tax=Streptomyces sp. VRA16 Mangrove soil TaxID=2817434 RepID=UPI001A9F9AE8|nr:condensation protein [Streptomyces sp. VRA16 Mangrove soil]MBO1336850.1 condensation protein [Streptomyces sp. VRA16 Mangrove soil]